MHKDDEVFTNIEARKAVVKEYDTEINASLEMELTVVALAHKHNLRPMILDVSAFDQ